jgi:hypothetical protein
MERISSPSIGQLDTRYVKTEDWFVLPPVDSEWDVTDGLPVDPEDGDRYVADGTDEELGWYDGYIYEWSEYYGEWIETLPVEGMMIWLLFELVFWVFFSGGWMEIGSGTYVNVDGDTMTGALVIGDGTNQTTISATGDISFEGTAGIIIPHLMQSDSTDQAIANVSNAQVVTFNTDVHHSGITRTSSSRFTITKEGSYLIAFSGVCIGAAGQTIEVWLRKGVTGGDPAVDVVNSNTIYFFKTTGVAGLVAVTFIEHFASNEYFEFWTWGSAVTSKWDATVAGSTPTRPACPSIIITANYVGKD